MNTKLTSTAAIAFLLSIRFLSAQITLEHTYTGAAEVADAENYGYKYFVTDYLLNSVQIYNEDHTNWKNISIPVPMNQYLYDVAYVSSKVFNTDDLLEFLVVTYRYVAQTDTSGYYIYNTMVVNENQSVLVSVPGGGYSFTFTDNNNKQKMVVYVYDYSLSEYIQSTQVFSLPDKITGMKDVAFEVSPAYPNPASDQVNLPLGKGDKNTWVVITDVNGREYSSYLVNHGQAVLNVSTKDLPAGSYIYYLKMNGQTLPAGRFIKK